MTTPSRAAEARLRRRSSHLLATLVVLAVVALPAVAFSADTVVATVPVGLAPAAVAVDPVAHRVYVANYNADTVSVIDGVTDSVLATVPMPVRSSAAFPIAVVADPLSGKAYAGTFWSDFVSVIGPGLSAVATISPPLSHGSGVRALALDPSGATPKVYAAIYGKNLVSVIDGSTDTIVKDIPVGTTPRALAVFASGSRRRVYVANRASNDVSVIDGATDSVVATVPTGAGPKAIAVDPDRGFAYVTSPASDTVTVIDDTDAATATIAVGDNPIGVAVDTVRRRVFVADYLQNAVTVIDADTLGVVATLPTAVQPYAVAVDQSAGKVFVTCYGGSAVTIFDASLAAVTVAVGTRPYALGIDEGLAVHKTFVGNWGSNDVSVIDPATGGPGPVSAGVDPLAGDTTSTTAPVLAGWASSTRAPYASAIVAVFYRLDGDPSWRRATVTDGAGTPSVSWRTSALGPLAEGQHRVDVAAMDQALAAASSSDVGAGGVSAALGSPASYAFTVAAEPPPAPPSTRADVSPAAPDGDGGWYLTQPSVTLTPDKAVPTYYGWDAAPSLTYATPLPAPVGTHTLSYLSGDAAHGFEPTASLTLSFDPLIPTGPVLSDLTHTPGTWSRDGDIVVRMSGAADGESGLAGLSAVWSPSSAEVPGAPFDVAPLTSSLATRVAEGSWYLAVRARDVAGNLGAVVRSGPYLVDPTPPTTTAEVLPRYERTAEITLTATDTLSGVAATSYRLDGGAWTTGTVVTAGPGSHVLEYRSVDRAGNEEAARSASFTVVGRYEETDPRIARVGRWTVAYDARMSGGADIWSEKRGSYVEVTFTGTSIDWIAPTGPGYGIARITVDGAPAGSVDLYSAVSTYGGRAWGRSGLAPGIHTVRIEHTGSRSRAAKGTRVALDAFDIDGSPVAP